MSDKSIICIDLIFLDLSNAFDVIPFDTLLNSIHDKGINGQYLDIIKNSLINRKQTIHFENLYSLPKYVSSGVAQGGVLSPILYNLYISDLPNYIKSPNFGWADDEVIVRSIRDISDINILQNDLNSYEKFCDNRELILNENKTKHLRITFRNKILPNYTLKGKSIEIVSSHKHLGLTYESKMSFNIHCSEIISKSLSKFNLLKNICKSVDGKTFLKLYKTYILPIIEYSNSCWTPNQSQSIKIEKIQKKITKYICFKMGKIDSSYDQRLDFLQINSLKYRRDLKSLKLMHKIKSKSNDIPNHWFNYFNFYETSRNRILIKTHLTSDKFYFNHCIKLFNESPIFMRNDNNFNSFLSKLSNIL